MRALDLEAVEDVTPNEAAGLQLIVDVLGEAQPQGSKNAYVRGGRVVLVEANKDLPEWRRCVVERVEARMRYVGWLQLDGPCRVDVTFWLPRPAAARDRAFPHVKPDVDKLSRAVLDALTLAEAIRDDARVVELVARKRYGRQLVGARITVTALDGQAVLA